ncbi:hypothetical protein ACQPXB_19430 [Amycolatopsis sp. CA-161197]|uniref:hypothetical protein n=1 Tax=Amycolatopsis sp. CA-161197 TaxID=3239922 RepID=UPI003D91373D
MATAAALVLGGAAVAVTAGLVTGGDPAPMTPAAPAAGSAPVASKPVSPPPQPLSPAVTASGEPAHADPVDVHNAHGSGAIQSPKHTSGNSGSSRSDADVYKQPINARPSGQVPGLGPVLGTKTGNTGPADEPVTTPSALPNPAATPPTFTPSVQPGP